MEFFHIFGEGGGEEYVHLFNAFVLKPPMKIEESRMSTKIASGQATPEEAKVWRENWNARAEFVLVNVDTVPGLFTVQKKE
jgi:hypothetical protein